MRRKDAIMAKKLTFTCPKSIIEILEGAKYVQS